MSSLPSGDPTQQRIQALARRRKQGKWQMLLIGGAAIVLLAVVIGVILLLQPEPSLTLKSVADQQVKEMNGLRLSLAVLSEAVPEKEIRYALVEGPEGAAVDPQSGAFSWVPTEEQGPGEYTARVAATGPEGLRDEKQFKVTVAEVNRPPLIDKIPEQTVSLDEPGPFRVAVAAHDDDLPAQTITYSLPPSDLTGLAIDAETGEFTWDPSAAQPDKSYRFTVLASDGAKQGEAKLQFVVRLTADERPIPTLIRELRAAGAVVEATGRVNDKRFAQECDALQVNGQEVHVFEYETADAADSAAGLIAADGTLIFGRPQEWDVPGHIFHRDRLLALYAGEYAGVIELLSAAFGQPFAVAAIGGPPVTTPQDDEPTEFTKVDEADAQLLELYQKKKLFLPGTYTTLRKIYADRFARAYDDQIKLAFGDDYDATTAWLNEHPDIREDLFNAIQPDYDDVAAALALFKELKAKFPDKIVPYAQLAIATAVVWDKDGPAVYDYLDHANRTQSKPVEPRLGAIENFQYFLDAEEVMQGRAQYLPWEFLTHLVNHRTPLGERKWALQNYLNKRVKFGPCYSDVPYDTEMLESNDQTCRLAGKDYTLPNIKQFGGVCAMQADFAARVGKSLGVPSMYVWGESQFGSLHAWVMWIELNQVTKNSINFSLESHGRYNLDQYYVGGLSDPQTGEASTDRALELRLHSIGVNPQNRRHADFIMRAYPMLRNEALSGVTDHVTFLRDVIKLSPGNDQAWTAVALMAREGVVTQKQSKLMTSLLDRMFSTFAHFPDFTWKIFDDFVSFQPEAKQRAKYYGRLVQLYEAAGRADLACEARLKLTDYVVESDKPADAIDGLAATVMRFPQEGRYVPKLLDRLEAICKDVKGTDEKLIEFYQGFLPKIPKARGNEPSEYCIAMYERAITRFREQGQEQLAKACETELAAIREPKPAGT